MFTMRIATSINFNDSWNRRSVLRNLLDDRLFVVSSLLVHDRVNDVSVALVIILTRLILFVQEA